MDYNRFPQRNRSSSIVIDANDKVWAVGKNNRSNSIVTFSNNNTNVKDNKGIPNQGFVPEIKEEPVHLGHSTQIRRKSLSYLKKELDIDYHQVDLNTLFNRFGTHPTQGLDDTQVTKNLEKYGKNELTPPKKEPTWLKFLKTLVGGFQLLLWTGAILSFIAYIAQCLESDTPPQDNLWLGTVLAVLVVVLGLFTFYQEYSSGKIMESFTKLAPTYANVIRNGKMVNINAKELVVGDILEVKFGDRIPADIRILECQGFKVDNSSLTGESEAQSRSTMCTDDSPMETKNLAYFSTYALEGTAKGVVVSVGDNTFIGRIAGLVSGLDSSDTPMAREVANFVKIISAVAVFFGLLFFIISLCMGYTFINSALFLIGTIVANVPEGLLVTFTVVLALTAKRMAKKNCLVKQLHAVETLGSTSVICSDKTGTLTQNKMTASHIWFGTKIACIGEDHGSEANDLLRTGSLCLRAKFLTDDLALPIGDRRINGDASECAILRAMELYMGSVENYLQARPKVFEIPFNSINKWQLSIHDISADTIDNDYLLVIKGAPERIIAFCNTISVSGAKLLLNDAWKESFNEVYEELGGYGERVIGFAQCYLPRSEYPKGFKFEDDDIDGILENGLTFTGLISMIDPPRPGVPDAVQNCRNAGIKVVMVTGDHPITAKAIARSVGIISEGTETVQDAAKRLNIEVSQVNPRDCNAAVVTGAELMEMSTPELDEVLRNHKEIVFARVSPQQKLVIVEGFQRMGHIVAVTGDGVNDSPALKKADIGISMGIAGSDVSKQAADMILLDDNFSSIVTGVEEGRLIFENLKKCICYLLAANIAELIPFFTYITLRIPLPLGTIPMLMICLGTDILPTISLSYEKSEGDIMRRPPRNPKTDKLVTDRLVMYSYGQLGMIEAFAGLFTYAVVMAQNGFRAERLFGLASQWDSPAINDLEDSYGQEWTYSARKDLEHTCWTAYFCSVVVCQWGNLLISKVRRVPLHKKLFDNWVVFVAIVGETMLACFLTYTPGLNTAISYMPVRIWWWLAAVPFCVLIVCYDEIRRLLLRNCPSWKWFQFQFYY